jgi:hypothetical protein
VAAIREKIAYLRGLLEGSELAGNEVNPRVVWEKMLEIFDAVAERIEELEIGQEELEEYVEALDADLGDLEEEVHGHEQDYDEEDDEDEDDAHFVEMQCPRCGETVYFEEDFLFDDGHEVACPECGEIIYTSGAGDDEEDEDNEEDEQDARG